ncbi:phosphatidylinositol 4-kinase [Striga asiatica]|uniref:Phosphatidylinositol 4-kinase n=1 Tax=Striga asiatica TaxID=4170 RepID=A0A5A7R472_STRAF|nr:phosphatidylinositol 4-kinase [Striga asiatica]
MCTNGIFGWSNIWLGDRKALWVGHKLSAICGVFHMASLDIDRLQGSFDYEGPSIFYDEDHVAEEHVTRDVDEFDFFCFVKSLGYQIYRNNNVNFMQSTPVNSAHDAPSTFLAYGVSTWGKALQISKSFVGSQSYLLEIRSIIEALVLFCHPQSSHPRVMAYVLRVLETFSPERVTFFLPQLLQALRYNEGRLGETCVPDLEKRTPSATSRTFQALLSEERWAGTDGSIVPSDNVDSLHVLDEVANASYKWHADAHRHHIEFEVGDYVWVVMTMDRFTAHVYSMILARKISPIVIMEKINPYAYHLCFPSHIRTSDVFMHLVPFHGDNSDKDD